MQTVISAPFPERHPREMPGPRRPVRMDRRAITQPKRTPARQKSRPMGRPTKYTPETIGRILEMLATGCTRSASAGAAGISRETFCQWMQAKPDFAESVLQAEACAEVAMSSVLFQAAMAGNVRAALAWLERRRPEDWSLKRCRCQQMRHMTDDQIIQMVIQVVITGTWPGETEKAF